MITQTKKKAGPANMATERTEKEKDSRAETMDFAPPCSSNLLRQSKSTNSIIILDIETKKTREALERMHTHLYTSNDTIFYYPNYSILTRSHNVLISLSTFVVTTY